MYQPGTDHLLTLSVSVARGGRMLGRGDGAKGFDLFCKRLRRRAM